MMLKIIMSGSEKFTTYFHVSSPVDGSNVGCGAQRVDRYFSIQGKSVVYTDNKVTMFTFESSGTANQWYIYTYIDNVRYYLGIASTFAATRNVFVITNNPNIPPTWYCYNDRGDGVLGPVTELNQNSQPVFFTNTPGSSGNNWIFAYYKDVFGGFGNNETPYMDGLSLGNTPLNTGSPPGSQVCNYYVWFD